MTERSRILLVDDDPGTVLVIKRILGSEHELRYALDGEAALEQARQWQPHLILLDAQMPGMTGTEVCRRLKAEPTLAGITVVFVTSLDASGAELMSLELGAVGVVTKPMEPEVLRRAVHAALQEPAQRKGAAPGETARADEEQAEEAPAATPAATPAETTADTPAETPDLPADGRPRVLIVDDDPSAVRTVHAALLELDGHFYFASSGEQALVMARRHRPDVALLDMYMPGLDGLATLRAIKADPLLADTQVIVVTRFGHPEMETRALEGGGVDFIAKPYTHAVLKARVGNVLRLRELARAQAQAEREHWQRIGNARLARVVAAASDAIVTADARGHVVLINAAACRLFGVDAALTIGRPMAALLPGVPLQAPAHADGGLRRQRIELPLPGGGRQSLEMSTSQMAQGDQQLTTLVLRDLTEQERREAEERAKLQAEAALRAKTMMLSYVARTRSATRCHRSSGSRSC
jgi:PAS domain S-box-containing protein